MNIYDFTVKKRNGEDFSLSNLKGKVMLIVNTATRCGFTPQYEGLEELYEKYNSEGLEILDFPCNQFMHQAPGSDQDIHEFCTLNYNTQFDQFAKIKVNGKDEEPLYKYLKQQKHGVMGTNIKWNFTKFLVDREGNVVNRYAPTTEPKTIEKDIKNLL